MNLPPSAAHLIGHYGYAAIALGTFLEGETVMLAAGAAAAAGLLSLPLVVLASMVGIFASDTSCFFAGRLAGARLLAWFPRLRRRLDGALGAIQRHDRKLILGFQFVPGLCAVTPMAFGMTGISAWRFLSLDLVGNAAWSLAFALGGAVLGAAAAGPAGGRWLLGLAAAAAGAGALALLRRTPWPRLGLSSA